MTLRIMPTWNRGWFVVVGLCWWLAVCLSAAPGVSAEATVTVSSVGFFPELSSALASAFSDLLLDDEEDEFADVNDDVLPLSDIVDTTEEDRYYLRGNVNDRQRQRQRQMQSTTTESSRVNIFQKLGESLGTSIVGLLFICCMPFLIWKNEGRHVQELSRIDYVKHETKDVDCSTAGDDTLGHLVHFTGLVTVGDGLLDFSGISDETSQLNIVEPLPHAILLKRTCFIYQKFEQAQQSTKKDMVGGGETRTTTYTVKEDWTPMGPQPATLPHLPNETNSRGIWDELVTVSGQRIGAPPTNENNPTLPPEMMAALGMADLSQPPHAETVTMGARVGAFGLNTNVILGHPAVFSDSLLPVPNDLLPDTVPGCTGLYRTHDNVLRTFPHDNQPQNGDIKIVYEYAHDEFDASFVVQQVTQPSDVGDTEAKFGMDTAHVSGKCNADLGDIWMVRKGRHSLQDMLELAKEDEKKMLHLIRAVACVLLLAGWIMLFSPFVTVLQVLPLLSSLGFFAVVVCALIVSCLCCLTITTMAYIRYRPLLAIGMLVVAGGIWAIVAWRLNTAAEEGGDQ